MSSKFGILSRLDFPQDWASWFIARTNPAIVHNLAKYQTLKKVLYLSAIEDIEGDYLEFGVFTGSSFCHALRCCRALEAINPKLLETRFWGFDSFQGFGTLGTDDAHPFYTDVNFETSAERVTQRARRAAKGLSIKLIPGFFHDSLAPGAAHYGIERARVIFIDSDTHSSAHEALTFCLPAIQVGTFIVLDDYFSYRGREDRGVVKAFNEVVTVGGLQVRLLCSYGMGGVAYVVSGIGVDAANS